MRTTSHLSLALLPRGVAVLALLVAVSSAARAQSTATLQGTVTDPSNAAVANARVLVHSESRGVDRTTQTDPSGAYLMPGLLPDLYRIEISAPGFQTAVFKDVKLEVATTLTENVQLHVGSVSEQIEVTGATPLVDTSTVSLGLVVEENTVQEIPLNGRHFIDLVYLTPGTMTAPQNGFLADPLAGLGQLGVDTAGQRENTTNWMVNGINLNDEVQNQATFQPSIDTVSEFKVDNSTFPAQYGRNSGAIVNIATRSGTNAFHGRGFEFIRNNFFDARNFFNPVGKRQSQFNRNNYGADLGGPIVKNKAFFFLSYEGLRQHQGLTFAANVPSAGSTSTSTAVTNLLKLLPAPNGKLGGSDAFFGSAGLPVNLDIGTGDISLNLSPKDQVHGYYAYEQDHRFQPQASGADVPGWGDTRDARRQVLTLQESHTFTSSLTNEARLGFNRLHITFLPNGKFDPTAQGIGLPSGTPANSGLPLISIPSANLAFGGPLGEPQGRGDTTGVFSDTMSWLRGRHSFQFGGEVRRFYNNNLAQNIGSFTFASLPDFLNDEATSFTTQVGNGNDKILEAAWGLFLQDSYKLRPNLTLSLGLRYDYNSAPAEAANRFSLFDPATDALVRVGTPGFSQAFQTNNKNFQPRVGIAWDPWGDGRTSIRAGYAIMTQQPVTNIATGLSSNPPFATPLAASSATNSITLESPPANPRTVAPFNIPQNYKDAYAQDWNLTIQRSLTRSMSLQVAYVGSKGTHLQETLNENQPAVANGAYQTRLGSNGVPQYVIPFSGFSQITEYASNGTSNYNALWVTLNNQFSRGLQFSASYTYSKSLDETSLDITNPPFFFPQDSNNLRADYGPSDFDARNRFVVSAVYQLPFKGNRAFSGWETSVISTAQSGNPIEPVFSAASPFTGANLRPSVTGPIHVTGSPTQWVAGDISTAFGFSSPCNYVNNVVNGTVVSTPICSPGNLGRNSIIGPSFVNTDLSVIKNTKISERVNLQLRAEAFDLVNHPNFGNPSPAVPFRTFTDPTTKFKSIILDPGSSFGHINSTRFPNGDFGSARQLQFGLKLEF